MDVLGWLTETASSLPLALVWALGGAFALLESGLGLGFFVPGETVVTLLSASLDAPLKAVGLGAFVVIGASAGDHVGYLLGRRLGGGLRSTRLIARLGVGNWDRAVAVLEKRGAWAVFLTRMVPVVRTLTPAAAGVAKVPYRAFLPASLAGAATWSALYVGLGYLARSSLDAAEKYLGNAGWVLAGAAVAIAAVVVITKVVRKRRRPATTTDEAEPVARVLPARRSIGERLGGTTGGRALFVARLVVIAAAAVAAGLQSPFVTGILLALVLLAKPIQAQLRPDDASAHWTEPTLDRIAAVAVSAGFVVAGTLPWQIVVALVLPEALLGLATVLAFRGLLVLPVDGAERARSGLQLFGLTALAFGISGFLHLSVVIVPGAVLVVGYLLFLAGVILSYVVAVRRSRAMLDAWQRRQAPSTGS